MEARESRATKPGIEAMEREAMVRKKREIEARGREEKSPRMEEDSPGVKEVMDMMNYDTAAEFQHILNDLREEKERKQKRDEMKKSGGLGAPGPVIANQPNPPLANKMQTMQQQKVQTDNATVRVEKQFGATVGGSWTEISLAGRSAFDVTFEKGAMILLRTPGATENSEAPRPSKKPKEDVDPQEKTPLRQSS